MTEYDPPPPLFLCNGKSCEFHLMKRILCATKRKESKNVQKGVADYNRKLILNCFTNATQFGKCNALPFSVALYQIV